MLRLMATLRVLKKQKQNSNHHLLLTGLQNAKAFLEDKYLHDIQTAHDQRYFFNYCAMCFHSSKVHEDPHSLKLALSFTSGKSNMHFVDLPVPQESQEFARQRQRNHDKFVKDLLAQKEFTSAAMEDGRK